MNNRFIHLLYVPTMNCNMGCKYCYLEENTVDDKSDKGVVATLEYAINKFKKDGIIPFNISLHGGEVTTLSKKDFHDLIEYIDHYYNQNSKVIQNAGFKIGRPHIKTNLYNLDKHLDTIKEFNVSISGSLDLPFKLHNKYRVTKGNKETLTKILENIELLRDIPNNKKVSATIFKEHLQYLDDIVDDIKYLDKNTCLDMNDFNFMIGFDYNSCGLLHHITEEEQLVLYNRMHQEFDGTNLDAGVNGPWFDEFGPNYCTNCDNCGDKFFLLERNGDIYSCVRGQKNPNYYYGNIYKNTVCEILNKAHEQIFNNHNKLPLNKECLTCEYLYLCKTGCPFVKNTYNSNKSYTCKLQKKLYEDRHYDKDVNHEFIYQYVLNNRVEDPTDYITFHEEENSLKDLIKKDPKLKYIYDEKSFIVKVDDTNYPLESQLLKTKRDILYLTDKSIVKIYMKKNVINEECDYPINNALYIMILTGNMVTYGDELRTKQCHLSNKQVYKYVLDKTKSDKKGYYCYDISNYLKEYVSCYSDDTPNNIFFTTTALRDYHYLKQKNNAYYHISAINLPFQNIEFYYIKEKL